LSIIAIKYGKKRVKKPYKKEKINRSNHGKKSPVKPTLLFPLKSKVKK